MRPAELPRVVRLPLLGKRKYLHGTTLFETLRELAPASSRLVFKIPRRIESDKIILLDMAASHLEEPFYGSLYWAAAEGEGGIGVYPLPGTATPERLAYDESLVTAQARLSAGEITFEGASPFSFIATLIPLHKSLLLAEINHAKPGQWFFTRFDTSFVPADYSRISVQLKANMGGRIAKSEVVVSGRSIGEIYFSWVDA